MGCHWGDFAGWLLGGECLDCPLRRGLLREGHVLSCERGCDAFINEVSDFIIQLEEHVIFATDETLIVLATCRGPRR